MTSSGLLTPEQAAKILNESRTTTTRRIKKGRLAAASIKIEGLKRPTYLVEQAAVEALAAELIVERETKLANAREAMTGAQP